tara:strand:+ start:13637 stop:14020 length:384 start_codon:yes stop_codon:yes gene_type:complete
MSNPTYVSEKLPLTLDQWSVMPVLASPYQDPITATKLRCRGLVYNHPEQADGSEIHTSIVCEIDSKNGFLITARNVYKLGQMSKGYEKFRKRNQCQEHVYFKHPHFLQIRHISQDKQDDNSPESFLF